MSGVFELFTEVTQGVDLRVTQWSLVEAMGEPFRLELRADVPLGGADELAASLLGQRATFAHHGGPAGSRARRGVVLEARVTGGLDGQHAELQIYIVPRLALFGLKRNSRVFQKQSIPEIIAALLEPWQLEHSLQVSGNHRPHEYLTQYRETDLAFLMRICAREGIGFYLRHEPFGDDEASDLKAEHLVFFDDASVYPVIASAGDYPGTSLLHAIERMGEAEHEIAGFSLGREIKPERYRLGDYDFLRPGLPVRALAQLPEAELSPIGHALGGEQLDQYEHAQTCEVQSEGGATIDDALAAVRLQQMRQRVEVGRGRTRCTRLSPGSTFTLENHPMGGLNRGWVITRVEHRGGIPEAGADEVYSNTFECVPANVTVRLPPQPKQVQQAMETGTVVGPKGEDLHVDDHGRVKVHLHWNNDGGRDEHASCWLRVAQQWAGANWGSQFIPRVGSEVLVGFLAGDVDRPIVMGTLYNAVRPTPFRLPEEAARSGFISQSTPGGEGSNELWFDDTKGKERIKIRAERDFEQSIQRDLELRIGGARHENVGGESKQRIEGDATVEIEGERVEKMQKSFQVSVVGGHGLSVDGDSEIRVSGRRATRIEGADEVEAFGESVTTYHQDKVERILGHQVTVVGQHDQQRSSFTHIEGSDSRYASGTLELASDKEIVFRVGDSAMRLTADGLEIGGTKVTLHAEVVQAEATDKLMLFGKERIGLMTKALDAKADDVLRLSGKEGGIVLDDNARIDGKQVKLNCEPDPVDPDQPPELEPPKVTTIILEDEDGNPMPGRRYVVVGADGSERSGALDADGKAELYLEEGGEIFFPDVDNPRAG